MGYARVMSLVERVREAGVVGAGGAGFPTHVKLAAPAEVVLGNGAECEPLLHKDGAVMERAAGALVEGMRLVMGAVGAARGVVAVKGKNRGAWNAVEEACRGSAVEVAELGDYYPAGDEFDLVQAVTGRAIPPGGLPRDVGCLVQNVETLVNVSAAAEGRAVTHKTLTVAGAVREPVTLTVPLGTSFRECLAAAGGATDRDVVLLVGGVMMGAVTRDLEEPVTKTTAGMVVLPAGHRLAVRKRTPPRAQAAVGKSACDQCRYCTELCPRYLLGYAVEPHQVMRGLGFTASGSAHWNEWAGLCCACGLCTLYACPEDLFPKEACDEAKVGLRRAGWRPAAKAAVEPHPFHAGRRVPLSRLMLRLDLCGYDRPAPWREAALRAESVTLPLKQHAGVACRPMVRLGDRVTIGQRVGEVPAGELGAPVHASIDGVVEAADATRIVLRRAV